MDAGLLRETKRVITTWCPDPLEVWRAAHLIDSWERIRLGESFDLDAAAMREYRHGQGQENGRQNGRQGGDVDWVELVGHLWSGEYIPPDGVVRWDFLRDALGQAGIAAQKTQLRTAFSLLGLVTTERGIRREYLADLFDGPGAEG